MTKYEWESELKKNIHRLPDEEIARVMDYYAELFDDKIESGLRENDIIAEFGNPVDVADKIMSGFDGDLKADRGFMPVTAVPTFGDRAERESERIRRDAEREAERVRRDAEAEADRIRREAENAVRKKGGFTAPVPPPVIAPVLPIMASPTSPRRVVESRTPSGGRIAGLVLFILFLGWIPLTVAVLLWSAVFSVGIGGFAASIAGIVALVPSFIMLFTSVPVALVQFACCAACIGAGILLIVITVKFCKLGIIITKKMCGAISKWVSPKRVTYEN